MSSLIVSSADLRQYNRWDAAFFVALHSVEARYHHLTRTLSVEEATATLRRMRSTELAPCLILARGQGHSRSLDAVIKEYPHLALALIEPTLHDAVQTLEQTIQQQVDYVQFLKRLSPPSVTSPSGS